MPNQIENNQLDLVEEVEKAVGFDRKVDLNMEVEFSLQTGDIIMSELEDGSKVNGYFDGTVSWSPKNREWRLQIRVGETDATHLAQAKSITLLNDGLDR